MIKCEAFLENLCSKVIKSCYSLPIANNNCAGFVVPLRFAKTQHMKNQTGENDMFKIPVVRCVLCF